MFDLIPPLPSLFSVIALLAAVLLWRFDKKLLALIPGGIAAITMFAWAGSLIGWAMGLLMTLALIVGVVFLAKMAFSKSFGSKEQKDSSPSTLNPATGQTDVTKLLADLKKENEAVEVR